MNLLFSLHLFYGYALCNLAIQATETNKCALLFIFITSAQAYTHYSLLSLFSILTLLRIYSAPLFTGTSYGPLVKVVLNYILG